MKKVTSLVLSCIIALSFFKVAVAKGSVPAVSAASACVYDCETGRFLFSLDENTKRPIASTTKIMTALVAIEQVSDLSCKVKVGKESVGIEGTSLYLKEGDVLTLKDLLYGVLLVSGNDAAIAVAVYVSGSVSSFVKLMNDKAEELSLTNTHFANPNGLTQKNHYSTAKDMAVLCAYALKSEEFCSICSSKSADITFLNTGTKQTVYNHNKLLSTYDGCIGVKTGFTEAAGRCLVSAVRKKGHTLAAVTLNAPNDWDDHKKLYDYFFALYKDYVFYSKDLCVCVAGGKREKIKLSQKYSVSLPKPLFDSVTVKVLLPRFVYAPVSSGEKLGEVRFYIDGEVYKSFDILSPSDVSRYDRQLSFFEKVKAFFGRIFK